MSRVKSKYIVLDNTADGLNARKIPANFTPTNYTPTEIASEGTDKISAHLKGLDEELASIVSSANDIGETSFSYANNQASPADITGFVFPTARSFDALVSISSVATASKFQVLKITGIYDGSAWEISAHSSLGAVTGVEFSITALGQLQYTSNSEAGFVSGTIKFRAITTTV
jgi:hypothetical protein